MICSLSCIHLKKQRGNKAVNQQKPAEQYRRSHTLSTADVSQKKFCLDAKLAKEYLVEDLKDKSVRNGYSYSFSSVVIASPLSCVLLLLFDLCASV